jgi:hypothetical protein
MNNKISECPICGEKSGFNTCYKKFYQIECKFCWVSQSGVYKDKNVCLENWNKRAETPKEKKYREALELAKKAIKPGIAQKIKIEVNVHHWKAFLKTLEE